MASVAGLTLTDELTHEICEWVMSGRPLAEYCATAGKPSLNTINNWRMVDGSDRWVVRGYVSFAKCAAAATQARARDGM